MIIFLHSKSSAQNQWETSSEDPGSGLKWTTWTQYVLFSLVNKLISVLHKTAAKESKYIVFTGKQVKKTWTAQRCLRRLGSTHDFYQSCWKNEISIFLVKFIVVCNTNIGMHSIFCTLLMMICSRPGQNLWWCCKDTAPEWLGQCLPQLWQESACSADITLQAHRPHHKPHLLQSATEKGNRCILKENQQKNTKPNKNPLKLDGVHDTFPWHSGLGCSGTVKQKG